MTQSRRWKISIVVVCTGALALATAGSMAQSYDPDQDLPKPTTWGKRVDKLGRGVSNVLFGWAELPKSWHVGVQREHPLTEIIATDTIKGVSKALIRTGIGVYETVTFFSDTSDNAYDTILEPEYLF